MRVSAITQQRRDATRWNVFIDGEYRFALSATDVQYFRLKEGEEVAEDTVSFILENLIYIKAQDTALHYIGYKMRTKKEVRQKMAEKEFSPEVIEKVMEFLEKYEYVDDRAYAVRYIKERNRLSPRSAYVLGMELRAKGIADDICQEVLAEAPPSEDLDALRWLEKKTRGQWPPDEKKKKQLYGFLQRKGYSYHVIQEAFARMDEEV